MSSFIVVKSKICQHCSTLIMSLAVTLCSFVAVCECVQVCILSTHASIVMRSVPWPLSNVIELFELLSSLIDKCKFVIRILSQTVILPSVAVYECVQVCILSAHVIGANRFMFMPLCLSLTSLKYYNNYSVIIDNLTISVSDLQIFYNYIRLAGTHKLIHCKLWFSVVSVLYTTHQ